MWSAELDAEVSQRAVMVRLVSKKIQTTFIEYTDSGDIYKCNNGYQTFIRKRSQQILAHDLMFIAKLELAEGCLNICADLSGCERFHIYDVIHYQSNVLNQMQF